ncbi:DUF1570 domain-containing protein [Bremerella cremea]|uniref:DUF1570 domain-containing protein n=1 Tax=Bremerella cremea TaxID=1031537 RepID=A0A368KQF9_9BACT|nr:DUF1570 domain-containing protein [Bremerella cremea]RCS42180.1 DUF1570 domain-containing protein [Bremerella cremea]
MRFVPILVTLAVLLVTSPLCADEISFERNGKQYDLTGQVIATHEAGIVLHTPDGKMWPIQQQEITSRQKTTASFKLQTKQELIDSVLAEMPPGSQIYETAHYLVAYNTSRSYAQWVGSMLERLHRGFTSYWSQRGVKIHEPNQPLVALVFDNQNSFANYAQAELGDAAKSVIGFYSMHTNYVVMFDLTGGAGNSRRNLGTRDIQRLMSRPDFQWSLATVVHEATHQLAFNSGVQQRFADVPLWFSEGLAIFFETPDVSSSRGWRGIGQISKPRLGQFQKAAQSGQPFLPDLLSNDDSLRKAATSLDRYAQAWAVTYFLQKRMANEYDAYLTELSQIAPLDDPPEGARIKMFQKHFGADLIQLENEIREMMSSLRP